MIPELTMIAVANSWAAVVVRLYFLGVQATGVESIGPTALRVNGRTVFNSAALSVYRGS